MMAKNIQEKTLSGIVIDEHTELTLNDLSRARSTSAEWIIELVEQGALEPISYRQTQWRFTGTSLQKARTAMHLQRDLGINLAGIALVMDLLDEVEQLRARVHRLDPNDNF